jgi:hypothetical protein
MVRLALGVEGAFPSPSYFQARISVWAGIIPMSRA